MRSVLGAAWRLVARRAISNWAILAAALITIMLATILVASGPIYAEAVTTSAVRRTLADAEVREVNVAVRTRVTPSTFAATDQLVLDELARAFSRVGGTRLRRGSSESFALPDQPGDEVTNLIGFRFFDSFDDHVTIVEGAWPRAGGPPWEAVINEEAASALGLGVGDDLSLTSRLDTAAEVQVGISGIYRVDDRQDAFWFDEGLDVDGVSVGASFTTFGPLVVTPETFFRVSPESSEIEWRLFPTFENLTVSDIAHLRRQVDALEDRLNLGRELNNLMQVNTGLGLILEQTERSLLATRSTTMTLTIQLAILAGYALLLTAGLLAESRQVETNLLRARGASSTQLLTMAGMEAALLIVPAGAVAPPLATLALRSFNHVGPLAGIDLAIVPVVTPSSYALVAIAAMACAIALVYPAFQSARMFGSVRAQRARQTTRGFVQRAGVDLALVVAAGVAFFQLRRYGAPITETVQGELGLDPLLVAAPALGLLAGAVVALRILPLLSGAAETIMARSRMLVPALGAWQVGRRPRRYSRAALLLMLAIGIGLFAVSYGTTWSVSQRDQSEYDVGADLRVEPDERGGSAIPYRVLQDAYDDLPGFIAAAPALRSSGLIARSAPLARFVVIDAAAAGDAIAFRSDLATTPIEKLMTDLVAGRFLPSGVQLSGRPTHIAVDLTVELEPLPDDFVVPPFVSQRLEARQNLRVFLLDGDGQIFRADLGRMLATGETVRLSADLGYPLGNGERLLPSYPISVIALEVYSATPAVSREATLTVEGFWTRQDGASWQPADLDIDTWEVSVTDPLLPILPPSISRGPEQAVGLQLNLVSGSTSSEGLAPAFFTLRPSGTVAPKQLPVLISEELADELGLDIGSELPLSSLARYQGSGVIVGLVKDFPTVAPESGEPVVVDYQTYLAATFAPGFTPPAPDEFWIAVEEDLEDAAASALRAAPFSSASVLSRSEREAALQADPVALGTIGSLLLGFVAAAIFAGIGFAVNATVSGRQRLVEFALMRAVGLSSRQLVGWLTLENAMLAIFGLAGGTALGLLLASLVLPFIAITQEATKAVPDVVVVYPWQTILQLEFLVLVFVAASVAVLSVTLRRMALGTLLRLGEE